MKIDKTEVEEAILKACKGHMKKSEVKNMLLNKERNIEYIYNIIKNNTYFSEIKFIKLEKINKNGKKRKINAPSLVTRILEYVFIFKVINIYNKIDNKVGLNCKSGCGLNAKRKENSVYHRMKHLYYDRRDLSYILSIDQRQCYNHCTPKVFRKESLKIGIDKDIIDFGINVSFIDNKLPIGTPASPLIHHIMMYMFDKWIDDEFEWCIRYADNVAIGCSDKAKVNEAKWRIKNYWWYELGIRANSKDTLIKPIDNSPLDFCGGVFYRNIGKNVNSHNKGFAVSRKRLIRAAKSSTEKNWSCYYGQLSSLDNYKIIKKIKNKMKFNDIAKEIKFKRPMDIENITGREIEGKLINVLDYEIRYDKNGSANWVKLIVSYHNKKDDKIMVKEFHGNMPGLYDYLVLIEKKMKKADILPIEGASIKNSGGYFFVGSTEQINTLEDYLKEKNSMNKK